MTKTRLVPTSSQTVGPFFQIGFEYFLERTPMLQPGSGNIEISGRVLDRDGIPVPDGVLEFWSAMEATSDSTGTGDLPDFPARFRRAPTDGEGRFSTVIPRPAAVPAGNGAKQAPHLLVLVFTRGLLRNLITRVYLSDEPGNVIDPVLLEAPPERRETLIAQQEGANSYSWNVVLQGKDETVFFAW